MTMTIAPVRLSSRRDNKVFLNHSFDALRLASEKASSGFRGSSMMTRSPPRPVSVPPTEVASRDPLAVSAISVSESFRPIRVLGNSARYQRASRTARKSFASFLAKSPEYEEPFRRRERAMQRFRSLKTLQKFSSVHAEVHNQFNQERHLVTRQVYKQRRSAAVAEWRALAA